MLLSRLNLSVILIMSLRRLLFLAILSCVQSKLGWKAEFLVLSLHPK